MVDVVGWQMAIRYNAEKMIFACRMRKEAVHLLIIFDTFFPLQQWERERSSVLRYTYMSYLF